MPDKKTYFISDLHFGVPSKRESRERENLFIDWLDEIQKDAENIFIMGDLFDFWFEYKTVVPKGYIDILFKLKSISKSGIKIHLFKGNHDLWLFKYLKDEINIELHREPEIFKIKNHTFYLAHGDGLGPGDNSYKFLKKVFECKINQWAFRWIHPDIGLRIGDYFSSKSRITKQLRGESVRIKNLDPNLLPQVIFSKKIYEQNPEIDFFVYGHVHNPLQININDKTSITFVGDWINNFSYVCYDGDELKLKTYNNKTI